MATRTAVVCDDHPIFRSGVVHCLNDIDGLEVVAEASDVASAIAKLQIYRPDILVCDLSMPGQSGFELIEWVQSKAPAVKVIVLSMHTELTFVKRARELGVAGFLAKDDAETDLVHAVHSGDGTFYTSESIGRENRLAPFDEASLVPETRLRNVSAAEMKVLVQLSRSKTTRQIAESLNLSPRTVEAHRSALAEKLDARGPNKLLEFAIRNVDLIKRHD